MSNYSPQPRAYSYVRFSTPDQMAGDSLRRQTAAAAKWAKEREIDLDNSSFQDLGVSAFHGDNAETGMLREFLQAVEVGLVARGSYLLIENLDRLSRDRPRKATRLLEDICSAGITVVTLSDKREYSEEIIDNDPMAMMWAFMTAIRANEESTMKSRRLREAWKRKKELAAEERRPLTGRLPAWLSLSSDRSKIELMEDRVAVIRRIFEETLAGRGQHAVASLLTREGIETFGDGKRKAKVWQRSYIKKILENSAVIGTFVPHDTRKVKGRRVRDPLPAILNYFPAAIETELFDRVAAMRAGNSAPKVREGRELSNVLAGLAKCPRCGATMTRVNKGRKGGTPYLVCTTAKGGGGCDYRQVKLDGLEAVLREHVGTFVRDCPSRETLLEAERQQIEAQLDGIGHAMDNLVDALEQGVGNARVRARLSELETIRVELETRLSDVDDRIDRSGGHSVSLRLDRVVSALEDESSTIGEINAALREAFASCVIDYGLGEMAFYWKHSDTPTSVRYAWVTA
ncbi:MAG: recombinase family protein [Agrobacterium sp.]|uniref:recombinase family protein n=1 Tax=Agrobacterium sp. TaxID=361 RepID=UPI0040335E4D